MKLDSLKKIGKRLTAAGTAFTTSMMTAMTVYADTTADGWVENVQIRNDVGTSNPFELAGTFVGIVITVYKFVGVILIAVGVGQLVLGFTREDPDAMAKGTKVALAGGIMVALKWLLQTLNVIA